MKQIPLGHANTLEIIPEERHTAAAVGNVGVNVVSTPSLIGFLEQASHRSILPFVEAGEVSVGTRVEVDHLAAAVVGRTLTATSRVATVEGRRITFDVEVREGERVIMKGRHGRAIVKSERLLATKGG